jgi:hypothetical protein
MYIFKIDEYRQVTQTGMTCPTAKNNWAEPF